MGDKRILRWTDRSVVAEVTSNGDETELTLPSDGFGGSDSTQDSASEASNSEDSVVHRFEIESRGCDHQVRPLSGADRDAIPMSAVRNGNTVWVAYQGDTYRIDVEKATRGRTGAVAGDEIRAPMTGTVLRVLAKEGDEVTVGTPVLVVEAMKMEHTLKAPRDGRISQLTCSEGDQVEAQSVLVSFASPASEPE